MFLLAHLQRLLFGLTTSRLVALVLLVMLVKTGVWCVPNLAEQALLAANPFTNPIANANSQYLVWNWLGPFLAWLVGARSTAALFAFYLCFAVAFVLLLIKLIFEALPMREARIALVLFAALPVSATAFLWVGYDAFTLFLMLLFVAYRSRSWVALMTGFALGMHHFEQGLFAVGALFIAAMVARRSGEEFPCRFASLACFAAALVAGKAALMALFLHLGIELDSGRIAWVARQLRYVLAQFLFHFQSAIWAVLGVGWLAAVKYADEGRRSLPFFAALGVLCLLVLPVSEDQTRVAAITSFPLVAVCWLLNGRFLARVTDTQAALLLLAWLLAPLAWVWRGLPKWSVFPYDIVFVLDKLAGAAADRDPFWPFFPW